MNEYFLQKLLERGVEALERIAAALEKDEGNDDSGNAIRGFGRNQ